jgi:hypothetical protein
MSIAEKLRGTRIAVLIRKSRPRFVALFLAALTAALGAIGAIYLDELVSAVKTLTLTGTLELEVAQSSVVERGQVAVLGKGNTREADFLLRDMTKVGLRPGNYVVQVFYPNLQGENELVMEMPVDVRHWDTTKTLVDYAPPNLITLNMDFPKNRYLREEQLAFSVRSNADGYLWLFSPERGLPNLFFPNNGALNNNIKAGKKYNFPPSGSFTLKARANAGVDTVIGIVTETDNQGYAFQCLKKVVPEVTVKVSLTQEEKWGYARAVFKVE